MTKHIAVNPTSVIQAIVHRTASFESLLPVVRSVPLSDRLRWLYMLEGAESALLLHDEEASGILSDLVSELMVQPLSQYSPFDSK